MPDHATPFRILTYADKQFEECGFGMIAFIATLGREPDAALGEVQCDNYFNPAVSESMRDTVEILIIETLLSDPKRKHIGEFARSKEFQGKVFRI